MTPGGSCTRCADLEDQVAWLTSELGEMRDAGLMESLHQHYGLTRTEAKLVEILGAAKGRIIPYARLRDLMGMEGEDRGVLKAHACHIRQKMGDDAVFTSWGQGFAIGPSGQSAYDAAKALVAA